jgi:hypothetical protein
VLRSNTQPPTARVPASTPRALLLALCVLPLACGSWIGVGGQPGGGGQTGGGAALPDAGSGGGLGGGTGAGGGSGGGGPGTGQCDLVGDGGCACLRLATLGFNGQWGQGDVFGDWLQQKALLGVTNLGGGVLTADALAPFEVIIVQDVRAGTAGQAGVGKGIGRTYSAEEVQVLQQWVANGGGLATLTGYADPTEVGNVNSLLAPFGLSYGSTQILFGGSGSTVPVTHWATHPVSEGITRIGVDNGYPVLGGGTLVAWEPNPGQYDVARAVDSSLGHVFAWGDEWITYNSEWNNHPDYQVARFWLNLLRWLVPPDQCQIVIPVG